MCVLQGILGITAPMEHGGSGMDAVAACIAMEELSASDPSFCLSYLGKPQTIIHSALVIICSFVLSDCFPLYDANQVLLSLLFILAHSMLFVNNLSVSNVHKTAHIFDLFSHNIYFILEI